MTNWLLLAIYRVPGQVRLGWREMGIMDSFIVPFWANIFRFVGWISPFAWVCALFPSLRRSYVFVDGWVLGHLCLSVFVFVVVPFLDGSWFLGVLFVYGALRIFEVVVYQVNVMLFDEYRARKAGIPYHLKGYRRIVLLLLHNYAEMIFWFATSYRIYFETFQWGDGLPSQALHALNTSFTTMTSFGQMNPMPVDPVGMALVFVQSLVGIFMTLLSLARFITLIPNPKSLDDLEQSRD